MWSVKILTLFPELYPGPLAHSITKRAMNAGLWNIECKNIRDFASDGKVDDSPYGGGVGMVLKADVLGRALECFFLENRNPIVYLSVRGKLFDNKTAKSLANNIKGINILCGRFEGIDERLIEEYNITEISMGDYVLSSGDIAAFSFIDCCLRFIPGILGKTESLNEESFGTSKVYENLLEYPHYTKPSVWKGRCVPEVLLSGHHYEIDKWRLNMAKKITKDRRPDLWNKFFDKE